ncbi:MAG: LptE family protein [Nitrospirota bacterium]
MKEPYNVTAKRNGLRNLSRLLLYALCSVLYALCLIGCGYTIHSKTSLSFDSIQIGKIENRTFEPKLQDRLHKALTEEFLKHGISIHQNADYKISGIIHLFELRVLSEKEGSAAEYEVTIKGDFRLVEPTGDIKEFKNIGSPFIVSFPCTGLMEDMIAFKELASERAIRDMAMEIVGILSYRGFVGEKAFTPRMR